MAQQRSKLTIIFCLYIYCKKSDYNKKNNLPKWFVKLTKLPDVYSDKLDVLSKSFPG